MEILLILIGTSQAGLSSHQKDMASVSRIHNKFSIDCKDFIPHRV
jgi:hypothetical protein